MMNDPLGYYEILGVDFDANEQTIKKNYRERAKVWHPDSNPDKDTMEDFQKLSVANDIIGDEKKRQTYDLLAQAYDKKSFPEMFALKIYTNQNGKNDLTVRAIRQQKMFGKLMKFDYRNEKVICNYKEAKKVIFKTSAINWFLGWWSWNGLLKTPKIIFSNYQSINKNGQDNLSLLIHNALAYGQEGKKIEACLSAVQALEYASPYQKGVLDNFIKSLNISTQPKTYKWNFGFLKVIQLIIPAAIALGFVLSSGKTYKTAVDFAESFYQQKKNLNYYQKVKFGKQETYDDQIVSKIINIAVNLKDMDRLYHITENTDVMYGPSEKFDVLARLSARHTIRLTGYSPDEVWSRIMLDNGQMGFVKSHILKKGIGREIPPQSKIFTKP